MASIDRSNHEAAHWRSMQEIPSSAELMGFAFPSPLLDQNEPIGKEEYLKTQFYLLRREGVEQLQRCVFEFRSQPSMQENDSIFIYTRAFVKGYQMTKLGAVCRLAFSTERSGRRIRWQLSKRLTPGGLVALSPAHDNFASICYVAVVAQRNILGGLEPDLEKGENPSTFPRIDLFWGHHNDAVFDPSKELVMIEAKGPFFESVRHAMKGLQNALSESSALDKYIIGDQTKQSVPEYINKFYDQGAKITHRLYGNESILEQDQLSSFAAQAPPDSALDHSQLRALQMVFSSELVLVQGPPGTGKTFTSLTAVSQLLNNFVRPQSPVPLGPIVVAAQSNFALDQFLISCDRAKISFARLGGRSTVEKVMERSLYVLRLDPTAPSHGYYKYVKALKKCEENMAQLFRETFSTSILNVEVLFASGIISQRQLESLLGSDEFEPIGAITEDTSDEEDNIEPVSNESRVTLWIGDQLVPFSSVEFWHSSIDQQDLDMTEEEVGDLGFEDDKDRLSGNYHQLNIPLTGRARREDWRKYADKLLASNDDLFKIMSYDRGMVYRRLQELSIERQTKQFRVLMTEYHELVQQMRKCRAAADSALITSLGVQVIGCTTTGLCKYRDFFLHQKPKVMLIEEAAETWEANITSSLFPSLQQLILVGDHMQLSPKSNLPDISNVLCVSLLERMVGRGLPHVTLQVQRRMIPELRQLFQPFYPEISDHEVVQKLEPIPGMREKHWFFTHEWPEGRNETSRYNVEEAEMIMRFYRHLLQNGVGPSEITVLTFYRGQVMELLKQLRKDDIIRYLHAGVPFTVSTVDGYQGKENDIVILSLTRSVRKGRADAGFLANQNRLIVSFSRARRGFYIFGNSQNLRLDTDAHRIWDPVMTILGKNQRISNQMPIMCPKHDKICQISSVLEWNYHSIDDEELDTELVIEDGLTQTHETIRERLAGAEPAVQGKDGSRSPGSDIVAQATAITTAPLRPEDNWQNLDSMMDVDASETMIKARETMVEIRKLVVTAKTTPFEGVAPSRRALRPSTASPSSTEDDDFTTNAPLTPPLPVGFNPQALPMLERLHLTLDSMGDKAISYGGDFMSAGDGVRGVDVQIGLELQEDLIIF